MATKTFGRRGAAPRIASPSFQPARVAEVAATPVVEQPAEPSAFHAAIRDNKLIADIPFLTFGLILLLVLVFMLEKRWAFDVDSGSELSSRSLIALGATSRDLVVGSGQWWRIALAPLLHASMSHVARTSIALAFVGMRLEPMIGRGWFLLIFVVSAIGGVAGSLYGNHPGVCSVGASGAVIGLLAALLVMSFNPYADVDQQRAMRRTALRFGVPALLPLAWGTLGGIGYLGLAGGALAGAATGMVICVVWSHDRVRPNFARTAGLVALAGFAGALLSAGVAANRYPVYAAEARQFIARTEMAGDVYVGRQRSAELLARAFRLMQQEQFDAAEAELRSLGALSGPDADPMIRAEAQVLLAAMLAKQLAKESCRAPSSALMKWIMPKAKSCD
jgi:membrane associated rhomboid family serine protease